MLTGLDINQFRVHVVRPVLRYLELYTRAAENLLVGTAITESRLIYIKQLGTGPALGVYQMEPNTYNDIYHNYLNYPSRSHIKNLIETLRDSRPSTLEEELIYNLAFATALCRIHYRRVPVSLPAANDARAMAAYWKDHYNTHLGAGTIEKALPYFQKACS